MPEPLKSFIAGNWLTPDPADGLFEAINPATEDVCAQDALCGPAEAEAVAIAHDTPYGLYAHVQTADLDRAA